MDIFEKNAWNDAWNKVLNRLGIRKVPGGTVNYLGNVLSTIETDLAKAGATTAAMTLYVDAATGLDTNTGLVGFPTKTIMSAVNKVPYFIYHNVTINVGPGTYAEAVTTNKVICTQNIGFNVIGTDWTTVVPTTGLSDGAISSAPGAFQVTLNLAGWTINDLRGKFIKITSGAKSGKYYPIAANSADTLDIAYGDSVALVGATFIFQIPSASITGTGTLAAVSINTTDNKISTTYATFVKNFNLSAPSAIPVLFTQENGGVMQNCIVRSTNKTTVQVSGFAYISNCYLSPVGAGYIHGISSGVAVPAYSAVSNTVIISEAANSNGIAFFQFMGGYSSQSDTIMQGFSVGAMLKIGGEIKPNALLIRNCGYGIWAQDGCVSIALSPCAPYTLNITNSINDGIYVQKACRLNIATFDSSTPIYIKSNGGHGIYFESDYSSVLLAGTGAFEISGNTGFGVKLAVGSAYNNIRLGANSVMNTNALGDLTLDGTTAISIADLRADPDKTVVDLIRLNRIAAD